MTRDEFENLKVGDKVADGTFFQAGWGTVVAVEPDDDYEDCPVLVTIDFGYRASYLSNHAPNLYKKRT